MLVGPVTKISAEALPRLSKPHFLGKREYEDLPAYLKAFDVAMMPFALNEATRSISPTKTLGYMAAHKPIVSTPIRDVVSLFGSVARIADGAEAFVTAVEAALGEDERQRTERVTHERELLERSSWTQSPRLCGCSSTSACCSVASDAIKAQIEKMRCRPEIQDYIVTGLADIEWEANGWLEYWRQPKQSPRPCRRQRAPRADRGAAPAERLEWRCRRGGRHGGEYDGPARHRELLDAAHILPDNHPHGEPVVPNGLAPCTLHHAALIDRCWVSALTSSLKCARTSSVRRMDQCCATACRASGARS